VIVKEVLEHVRDKTRRCSLLHQKPLFDDDDDDDDDDDSWKSGTLLADQLTSSDDCPAEHPFLRLTRGLKRNELIVSPRCIPHRGTEKSQQRTSYDARASIYARTSVTMGDTSHPT